MATAGDFLRSIQARNQATGGGVYDPIALATSGIGKGVQPESVFGASAPAAVARRAAAARVAPQPLPAGGFKAALGKPRPATPQPPSLRKQLGMSDADYSTIFGTEPAHAPAVRVARSMTAHKQSSLEDMIFGKGDVTAPPDKTPPKQYGRAQLNAAGLPISIQAAGGIEPYLQRIAREGKSGGPVGSFLSIVGSILSRPESAVAFGTEALADVIRGDTGAAAEAGKNALKTLVPGGGGPVTSFSDSLRRAGIHLPTGVGPTMDILGDPVNLVFPESIATKPVQAAERTALERLATEAGVPGQDILEATARHVHRGEAPPQFPMPAGVDTAVAAAEERVAKAQAAYEEADAAHKEAIAKRATPKQVLSAERKRAKAEAVLKTLTDELPGTPAQRRAYVGTFGQPATGEAPLGASMGRIRGPAKGTPRQQAIYRQIFGEEPKGALTSVPAGRAILRRGKAGGLARPAPADIPYPIVGGQDATLAQLENLTNAVRSYTGKKAVSVTDVMDLQRHISEMSRRIDELPGLRGKTVPRTPGTPEAALARAGTPEPAISVPRPSGPDLLGNVRAERPQPVPAAPVEVPKVTPEPAPVARPGPAPGSVKRLKEEDFAQHIINEAVRAGLTKEERVKAFDRLLRDFAANNPVRAKDVNLALKKSGRLDPAAQFESGRIIKPEGRDFPLRQASLSRSKSEYPSPAEAVDGKFFGSPAGLRKGDKIYVASHAETHTVERVVSHEDGTHVVHFEGGGTKAYEPDEAISGFRPPTAPPPPPGSEPKAPAPDPVLQHYYDQMGVKPEDLHMRALVKLREEQIREKNLTSLKPVKDPEREALRRVARGHGMPVDDLARRMTAIENAESTAKASAEIDVRRAAQGPKLADFIGGIRMEKGNFSVHIEEGRVYEYEDGKLIGEYSNDLPDDAAAADRLLSEGYKEVPYTKWRKGPSGEKAAPKAAAPVVKTLKVKPTEVRVGDRVWDPSGRGGKGAYREVEKILSREDGWHSFQFKGSHGTAGLTAEAGDTVRVRRAVEPKTKLATTEGIQPAGSTASKNIVGKGQKPPWEQFPGARKSLVGDKQYGGFQSIGGAKGEPAATARDILTGRTQRVGAKEQVPAGDLAKPGAPSSRPFKPAPAPKGVTPKDLTARARLEPGQGLTAAQSRAANKMITAAQKLVRMRQRSTEVAPRELIRLGQEFEAARAAFKGLMEQTRSAVREGAVETGRAVRARAPTPPNPLPLQKAVGRVQGGRAGLEDILGKTPERPARIGRAGRRLGKAEKRLQEANKNLNTALARQRKIGPGDFNEAQAFVEATAVAAQAGHEARMASPIGIRVGFGVGKYKKNVAIPLLKGDRARAVREVAHETSGEITQRFATRYAGREHMGAAGAIQGGDQWSMGRLVQGRHDVAEVVRKHDMGGVANAERRQAATFVRENSIPTLADDERIKEMLRNQTIQGADRERLITRLEENQRLRKLAEDPKVKALAEDVGKIMDRLGNEATDANVLHVAQLRPDYMPIRFIPESKLGEDVVALSPKSIRIGRQRFVMPGRTAMEKARRLPSVKMAHDLHPGLIETDIAELLLTRMEEQTKALKDAAIERAFVRHWGRMLAEGEDVPDGYVHLDGARFIPQNAVVEEAVAKTMKELTEEAHKINVPRKLRGGLFSKLPSGRKAMAYWKRIKLLTPAYDFRNSKDDMWLALQSGVNPVAAARQGVRVLRGGAESLGKGAEGVSAAEAKFMASRLGVTGTGYVGGEVERELGRRGQMKMLSDARRMPHRLRISREDAQRAGSFAHLLRKGQSPYEAALRSRAMHFTYHDPGTVVERLRSGMLGAPFMTWTTKNVPRQLKLLATRPGQFMARQRALVALGQQAGAPIPDILAPWNQQEQPTPVPGAGWLFSRDPITDLNTMLPQANAGGMNEFLTNALGLFAPLPQAGLEAASAMAGHPFSLRQRREQGNLAQADPIEARIAAALGLGQPSSAIGQAGVDTATRAVPRWFHAFYQVVNPALAGAAGRSLASTGDVRAQGLPASVLQSLTGLQILPFNSPQDARYAIINAKGEIKDAIKEARTAGYALAADPRSKEAKAALEEAKKNVIAKRAEAQRIVDEIRRARIKVGG